MACVVASLLVNPRLLPQTSIVIRRLTTFRCLTGMGYPIFLERVDCEEANFWDSSTSY